MKLLLLLLLVTIHLVSKTETLVHIQKTSSASEIYYIGRDFNNNGVLETSEICYISNITPDKKLLNKYTDKDKT
jgi:hypothetical protein